MLYKKGVQETVDRKSKLQNGRYRMVTSVWGEEDINMRMVVLEKEMTTHSSILA